MEFIETGITEIFDMTNKGTCMVSAGAFGLALLVEEIADLAHFLVECFHDGEALKEFGQGLLLII